MLLASVALHALVFLIPMSTPEPLPEVEKEEEQVQLSSLTPLIQSSPRASTAPSPKAVQPTPLPRPVSPVARAAVPPPVSRPVPNPIAPPIPSPTVTSTPTESPVPNTASSPLTVEEEQLQDLWGQFQNNLQGVAASETAGLGIPFFLFPQPELFFTAESLAAADADPSLQAEKLPDIDNILWASRRRPADVWLEVQQSFEAQGFIFTQAEPFGDGDVYKMEKAGTIRYVNLVRARDRSATFVVIWNRDPNQPIDSDNVPPS